MKDTHRLILFLVFTFSLVMLWESWQRQHAPAQPAVTASAVGASKDAVVPAPSSGTQAAVPTVEAKVASVAQAVIKTDLIEAVVSAKGGDIMSLKLLTHKTRGDGNEPFVLFDEGKQHDYAAQSGLTGEGMPNHNTVYTLSAENLVLAPGQNSVTLSLTASGPNGVMVTKKLTFHRGSYLIDVSHELENNGAAPVASTVYYRFARDNKPAEEVGFFGAQTYTGPAFYTEAEKFRKVAFSDIEKNKVKPFSPTNDGWVAMVQHYFVAAFLPKEGQREFFVQNLGNNRFAAGVKLPLAAVAPGQKGGVTVPLYAGPQEQKKIADLAPGFDLVVDYGMLTVIAAPIFWFLSWLHALVGNWGWAIIVLTMLLKLVFFPLSAASYKSMAKMRAVTPRMVKLKEVYANDRMKLNQEMMELYKKEKINPLGGCLPVLVQIPVFIALYWVLLASVEMRQAPWLGWITDLSAKDPYFVLPIIMGVTMFIQTKLNPTPPDPIQAKVMMIMPLMFSVMFLFFPAGLVLYWTVNNILSIAQQWQITRAIERGASKSS
jgi:YidC/Oxa1 family membrane protein insertase